MMLYTKPALLQWGFAIYTVDSTTRLTSSKDVAIVDFSSTSLSDSISSHTLKKAILVTFPPPPRQISRASKNIILRGAKPVGWVHSVRYPTKDLLRGLDLLKQGVTIFTIT